MRTCDTGSISDLRDRAILMVAFASGGRRRSEIATLRVEQPTKEEPITVDGASPLTSLAIHLGRTKTSGADAEEDVYLAGRPIDALLAWLEIARIDRGALFRKIDRWGIAKTALICRQSIRLSNSVLRWQGWTAASSRRTVYGQAI